MKEAIREVYQQYKYTSLPEYNAALRLYNITADPGGKDSRIHQHGGLVYRALDEQGNKVGVPIKASSFYFKPMQVNLQEKYEKNTEARDKHLDAIRSRVDLALLQNPGSLRAFIDQLHDKRVEVVIRQNEEGRVYGLTYVDKETKTVINGSDLGKPYSASNILKKIDRPQQQAPGQQQNQAQTISAQSLPDQGQQPSLPLVPGFNSKVPQILSELMQHQDTFGRSPRELEEEQKIRRRRLK
jgi:hypothetical protein